MKATDFTTALFRNPAAPLLVVILLCLPVPPSVAGEAELQAGRTLFEQGEYQDALQQLIAAGPGLTDSSRWRSLVAECYLGYGRQLIVSGDYRAAGEAFRAGRDYADEDLRFFMAEASAWFHQGRYDTAGSVLQQAVGIDPDQPELLAMLGRVYYAGGRMTEAIDALQRSRDAGGGDKVARFLEKVEQEWRIEQTMNRERSGTFLVSVADDGPLETAAGIRDLLEEIYAELGSEIAFFPEAQIPVLVYANQDFKQVVSAPDWAGAIYDGKIRIPIGGVDLNSPHLLALLYHEYAHVLVRYLGNGRVPVWLNEGFAELASRRIVDPPLQRLAKAVDESTLFDWLTLSGSFADLPGERIPLAYEQSYSLVSYLAGQFGMHSLKAHLEQLGKGRAWDEAVEAAYGMYGVTWQQILVEWRLSLRP